MDHQLFFSRLFSSFSTFLAEENKRDKVWQKEQMICHVEGEEECISTMEAGTAVNSENNSQ